MQIGLRTVIFLVALFPTWSSSLALLASSIMATPLLDGSRDALTADWLRESLTSSKILNSLLLSVLIGLVVGIACSLLGWVTALGARALGERAKWFGPILFLPLMLPANCLSIALVSGFRALHLSPGSATIILGHILLFLGLAFSLHLSRLDSMDPRISAAAQNLVGEGSWRTALKIHWAHQQSAFAVAGMLSMALSVNEGVVATYVGGFSQPLAVRIQQMMGSAFDPATATAAGLVFIGFLTLGSIGLWHLSLLSGRRS